MKRSHLLLFLCVAFCGLSYAQNANGILASSRAIDWSRAGVVGGIPTGRTQCGSTIAAYSGSATAINNAISSCGANQYVLLGAGTFTLSTGIDFNNKSNVTLRGSGSNSTFLVFNSAGAACGGIGANVCLSSAGVVTIYSSRTANWTAGYGRGATALTFSNTSGLSAGMHILLDQANDDGADTFPEVWNCHQGPTVCSVIASPGEREQMQLVTVQSVVGTTVNITPGLYLDNWRSARSPAARWSSGLPATGQGLENLSINGASSSESNNIALFGVINSWVKGVRSVGPGHHHVKLMGAPNNTIRDSYFFGVQSATSESYGLNLYFSGDALVENNIFQLLPNPQVCEYGWGTVFAYNFSINNNFGGPGSSWGTLDGTSHRVGCYFLLWEGNQGMGVEGDNYHGSSPLNTVFRNRYTGSQPGKDTLTNGIQLFSFSRFWNVVGNVLGDSSWATTYQMIGGVDAEDATKCNHSVFAFGWGGNCDRGSVGVHPPNDLRTSQTALRWGNWDTVTGTSRFVASEVPSGLSKYANPVPASQTLPASFYLSGKPSWWGSTPWPAIGPDVTGGDISNVGGHAYRIPARKCFENVMGGQFADTVAKAFNATTCYVTGSTSGPAAPTSLLTTVR